MHMHSIHSENAKTRVGKSQRWGKPHKNRRDWKEYNEELVIRGRRVFDLDFIDQ